MVNMLISRLVNQLPEMSISRLSKYQIVLTRPMVQLIQVVTLATGTSTIRTIVDPMTVKHSTPAACAALVVAERLSHLNGGLTWTMNKVTPMQKSLIVHIEDTSMKLTRS